MNILGLRIALFVAAIALQVNWHRFWLAMKPDGTTSSEHLFDLYLFAYTGMLFRVSELVQLLGLFLFIVFSVTTILRLIQGPQKAEDSSTKLT